MIKENKQIRILIVDDDKDIRELLSHLLQKRGFITEEAKNGKEGLEKISTLKPDIIILDVVMPQMDGFQTCQFLKRDPATQSIPIIFLSSQKEPDNFNGAFPGAAIEYLEKSPYNFGHLLAKINNLIHN